MPSFVITASVYVDYVTNGVEATRVVNQLNDAVIESGEANLQIVLPDNNPQRWEEMGPDEDD